MKRQFNFTPLIMALALIAATAGHSFAALTAGTTISNQASVTYAESAAAATSNTVNVTVSLVSGLAWLDSTLSPTTLTVASGGAVSYSVDLHNTGNGTTTATITDGTTQVAASLGAGTWNIAPNNPVLYGAISSGAGVFAAGVTTIPVDFHVLAALTVGDRIMINGNLYVVAAGSTPTQLVVTGDASTDVAAAGVQLGEVRSITFSGTAGTLVAPDLDENHNHSMTATDDVGGGVNADGNPSSSDTVNSDGGVNNWYTRVVAGALSVLKYSRNATGLNPAAAADIQYGPVGSEVDYWLSGVKGISGVDTIEYLVVITNAGPGDATDVTMTDTISSFLALTTTSVDIDTNGDGTFDATDAVNNNLATYAASLLTVYAGSGGNAGTTTGGTVTAAAGKSAIRYQAAIQ